MNQNREFRNNNRYGQVRNRNDRGNDPRPDGDDRPEPAFERPGPPQQREPQQQMRRGGGRGGHRPPRQAAAPGVPQPQHRVAAGSQMKNDPLFISVLNAAPGSELRPIAQAAKIFPSAAGLTELVDQMHDQFVATSPGYARRVPKVALAYYAATATYANMLKKVELNSFTTSEPERSFANSVIEMTLELPKPLQLFCEGFGNVQVPDGRLHRMDMAPRTYEEDPVSDTFGWFGRVNAETHWMYRDYPNLASYAFAISRAIIRGGNDPLEYELPDAILPIDNNRGTVSRNFLGYTPIDHLRADQRTFLNEGGFTDDGTFESSNTTIPLLIDLLRAVQQELDQVKISRQKASFKVDGSLAQIPFVTELITEGVQRSLKGDLEVRSPCDVLGAYVIMSSAFAYRTHYRADNGNRARNKWSVFTFVNYRDVPIAWRNSANALRALESPYLQQIEMRAVSYLHVPRTRMILEATLAE